MNTTLNYRIITNTERRVFKSKRGWGNISNSNLQEKKTKETDEKTNCDNFTRDMGKLSPSSTATNSAIIGTFVKFRAHLKDCRTLSIDCLPRNSPKEAKMWGSCFISRYSLRKPKLNSYKVKQQLPSFLTFLLHSLLFLSLDAALTEAT